MTNLIGDDILSYEQWLTVPGATVHLYGKAYRGRAARWAMSPKWLRRQEAARFAAFAGRDFRSGPLQAFHHAGRLSLSQR